MNTDPIGDMITRINNALQVKKDTVEIPDSSMKRDIARILKNEGYIADIQEVSSQKNFKNLKLTLKYFDGHSVIQGMKRVSKPGRRIYTTKDKVPHVMGGLGITILSTSQGIVTDKHAGRKNLGGEILCKVW